MKAFVSFISVWRIGLGACLAVFMASGAQAGENAIQEQARLARASIEAKASNPISPKQAQVLWQRIEKTLSESRAFKGSNGPTEREDTNIRDILMVRLHRVFDALIQQKRVHLLTPEGREELNIEQSFCATKDFCRMPRAFYLPLPGLIFLNGSLDEAQLVESFFHELMHAYQFSYRLPLDLILANKLAEEGKISASSVYDFLSYFYETQANWQTLRFNPENPWKKHYQMSLPVSGFASQLAKGGLFLLAPVPYMLLELASRDKVSESEKPTLPKVDHRQFYNFAGSSNGVGFQGARAAIGLHEICLQNKASIPVFSHWDAKFHRQYAKAVERTYFGKLDFIFRDGIPDNDVFNVLHNYYYSYLGEMHVESEQEAPTQWRPYAKACDALFARSVESQTSPLAFWLSLPREEFQSCPTYNIVTRELRRLGFENLSVEVSAGSDEQISVLTDRNLSLEIERPRVNSDTNTKDLEIRNQDLKSQGKGDGLRLYSRSLMEIRGEEGPSEKHRSPFLIFEKDKAPRVEDPNSQQKLMGGEGTTPDIPVLPALPILPQLEVSPD